MTRSCNYSKRCFVTFQPAAVHFFKWPVGLKEISWRRESQAACNPTSEWKKNSTHSQEFLCQKKSQKYLFDIINFQHFYERSMHFSTSNALISQNYVSVYITYTDRVWMCTMFMLLWQKLREFLCLYIFFSLWHTLSSCDSFQVNHIWHSFHTLYYTF